MPETEHAALDHDAMVSLVVVFVCGDQEFEAHAA